MIASQLVALTTVPNKAPRGTPTLNNGNPITLSYLSGSYGAYYFSGAIDDPADTVLYSITSSNPSIIAFDYGTDRTINDVVYARVVSTVGTPTPVTCTITTKDRFGAVGASNNITITAGTLTTTTLEFANDTTWAFPDTNIKEALIYVQAQGGGGGGGGARRDDPTSAGVGQAGSSGAPGSMVVASYIGKPPISNMSLVIGKNLGDGGAGGLTGNGYDAVSHGSNSTLTSSFLNITAIGGLKGSGGQQTSFFTTTTNGYIGTAAIQPSLSTGTGSGAGWSVDGNYSGGYTSSAVRASKNGNYADGGYNNYGNARSTYAALFGGSFGNGGTGGWGRYAYLGPLVYENGGDGEKGIQGIIRIRYTELF